MTSIYDTDNPKAKVSGLLKRVNKSTKAVGGPIHTVQMKKKNIKPVMTKTVFNMNKVREALGE
jgi:hypothetical protein